MIDSYDLGLDLLGNRDCTKALNEFLQREAGRDRRQPMTPLFLAPGRYLIEGQIELFSDSWIEGALGSVTLVRPPRQHKPMFSCQNGSSHNIRLSGFAIDAQEPIKNLPDEMPQRSLFGINCHVDDPGEIAMENRSKIPAHMHLFENIMICNWAGTVFDIIGQPFGLDIKDTFASRVSGTWIKTTHRDDMCKFDCPRAFACGDLSFMGRLLR